MTLSNGFRRLAASIEELEAQGLDVHDVTTADDRPERRLTVELTLSVPCTDDGTETQVPQPDRTSGGADDDRVEREQVVDPHAAVEASGVSGAETPDESGSEGVGNDDAVTCPVGDCDATFESEHGMKIHRTKVHRHEDDAGDEGLAAYRDPERLRDVYAACDSFTEMRDALDTDVSAQTVRRQMIAHGIYEPGEGDPGARGDDGNADRDGGHDEMDDAASSDDTEGETPAAEPDEVDIELPEGVTVADLKRAVLDAKTLYDVQTHFDLEREAAMELLETYDLLDVVHGRVSNRDARKEVDEDEITRRILERVPAAEAPSA